MRKLVINLCLLLIIIIIFALFIEITLYALGLNCAILDNEGNSLYYITKNQHFMKPNYEGRYKCVEYCMDVQTNSQGFRDDDFKFQNGIMLLGDSIAFGYGMKENENFASILEKSLDTEIYNLAVPGYSLKEFTHQIPNYLPKLNPKLTIVTIYEGNDPQETCGLINRVQFLAKKRQGIDRVKDILKKTYTIRFFEPLLRSFMDMGATAMTSKQFYLVKEPVHIQQCNILLKNTMQQIKTQVGEDLLFVIIPSKINFEKSKDPKYNYNKKIESIMEFCSDLDINCLNLQQSLQNPQTLYFNEGHLNKKGHKEIALILKEFLEKEIS